VKHELFSVLLYNIKSNEYKGYGTYFCMVRLR
jgi:hypothetical protein